MSATPTMARRFVRKARVRIKDEGKPFALQPKPPDPAQVAEPRNLVLMALPVLVIVMIIAIAIVFWNIRGNSLTFIFPGVAMFGMVGYMLMSGRMGRQQKKTWGQKESGRRIYREELDELADSNQENSRKRFETDRQNNAAPRFLPQLVGGERFWERRTTDSDFSDVRLGTGVLAADQGIFNWHEVQMPKHPEVVQGNALRRFMIVQTKIENMGKVVNLRSQPGFGFVGDVEILRSMVRAMCLALATYHAPDELKIVVVSHQPKQWEWIKVLPHARHDTLVDACGRRRLYFESPADLEDVLGTEFAERELWNPPRAAVPQGESGFSAEESPLDEGSPLSAGDAYRKLADLTHWVVIDDNTGNADQWTHGVTGETGFEGVTFLRIAESIGTGVGFKPEQIYEVR